jgi:hypothetical protein
MGGIYSHYLDTRPDTQLTKLELVRHLCRSQDHHAQLGRGRSRDDSLQLVLLPKLKDK